METTNSKTPYSLREQNLRNALLVVLDHVDYTASACTPTEMVGAVLPREVIALARKVLEGSK